jgi:23S rRNA pseudouridine1911/1915/1917 synthase
MNETADSFYISAEEAGLRLDKIVASRYKEVRSRTYFQSLIDSGKVLINHEPVKKRILPREGDHVEIMFALSREMSLEPEPIPLDILYEDDHFLVINKPAGLVVHPAPGNWNGTLVNGLLHHCNTLSAGGTFTEQSPPRPGIVHRLDKDTSGVILLGKNDAITAKLSTLFAAREVYKEYTAICIGNPGNRVIDFPLGRHPIHRKMMAVIPDGRPSITHCRSIAHDEKFSVVQLVLETGRTHQIRVHLKTLNCPILGDSTYGNKQTNERWGAVRPLLHSRVLRFRHPITGVIVEVSAPLPEDFTPFLQKLGCERPTF